MGSIVGMDNEFMTVSCDPESGIVQHVMHRFVISAIFREGLEAGLKLLAAHGATKWLSDDRNNGPLSGDDAEWVATSWRPRAIAAGLVHWALVMPDHVFGRMRLRRHVTAAREAGLVVETFEDAKVALGWLESQPRRLQLPRAPR